MATLVDTNVLIDILQPGGEWEEWSTQRLYDARIRGAVIINPLIYAEMAAGFDSERELESALPASRFGREDLPWGAAFRAGQAFSQYRRTDGLKRSPPPDFYIGAHALLGGHELLTRDYTRYATYFPMLRIIAPDTHP